METQVKTIISVQTNVKAPIEIVWKHWTSPNDILGWNHASADWNTPKATNDLRVGGTFNYRMEAKDGSIGFDFFGVYDVVIPPKQIEYTMGDGRKVTIVFNTDGNTTNIMETFEAETINSIEMQKGGWQAILNNFKTYSETH